MKDAIILKILLIVLAVAAIITVVYVLFIATFFTIHGEGETSVQIESEEIQIE